MKTFSRKFGFSISALLPVILLSANSAAVAADDTEPSIYGCKACVKYTGWRGSIFFGGSYVDDSSYRFGDYRGLDEKGWYLALDGDVHFRDLKGYYFDLNARNLGYASREIDMRGGNQGFYEIRLGYQEIPRYRGYGAETPFLGVGGDFLSLPDNWVKANTTSGMTALNSSLATEPLETKRKILDAGATLNFLSNWSYRFDYQRQDKQGTYPMGGGMYFSNASIMPAPVDFTTDLIDTALSWISKRAQVEFGFRSSQFNNGYNSLTWQNPFSSQPQHDMFRLALAPDNEYYQFYLSGALALASNVKISGQASFGNATQNDPFLPYTINPEYSDLPLPRASLDGKLDTSTYFVGGKLFWRVSDGLTFNARGKWDERDNKTPVDEYTPVVTDLVPTPVRYNRPYSFKRQQYSADLSYRAARVIRLNGGVKQNNIDRTLQAVERTKETTWWGEVKVTPTFRTEFRIKGEWGNRDISDYQAEPIGIVTENPLMRVFYMADRELDRYIAEFDYMITDSLGLNFGYGQTKSQYKESVYGLQQSDDNNYSVNLNYAMGSKLSVYGWYNYDIITADMVNTSGGATGVWTAETRNRTESFGLGLKATTSAKSSLSVDYVYSDSTGKILVQTSADEPPFSPLIADLQNFKVKFDYDFNDHWGYRLYAEYEKFRSTDWAIDGIGVDGINSILTMGEESPDYGIWYYRLQLNYRF